MHFHPSLHIFINWGAADYWEEDIIQEGKRATFFTEETDKKLENTLSHILLNYSFFLIMAENWKTWLSKLFITICIQKPVRVSNVYMKCNVTKQSLRKSRILLCWKGCFLILQVSPTRQMGIYMGIEDASLQNTVECHIPATWLILEHSKEMKNCWDDAPYPLISHWMPDKVL